MHIFTISYLYASRNLKFYVSLEVRYIRIIGDGYTIARFFSEPCTILRKLDIDIDDVAAVLEAKSESFDRGWRIDRITSATLNVVAL